MASFTESLVEQAALAWFEALEYRVLAGPSIAPGEPAAERSSYGQVVLEGRLREALRRLNPAVPSEALDEAFRKLTRISSPQLVDANHELHHYLVNGVSVELVTSTPRISRHPALTPVAIRQCALTVRPPSRTFWVSASIHTNV